LPIDLPYALRLVNASNPTIAIAQERVREAYAHLDLARVLWVPNLWAGSNPDNLTFLPNFYVHNGNLQTSSGNVISVVKASVALPVGTGLNLSIADALFGPRIARNLVAAEVARSRVVVDNVQLDVALTYLDLLRVYGALAITAEATAMADTMYRYADQAVRAGFGKTTADANRARSELELRRQERLDLEGEAAAVSARLAQLLLLEPTVDLVPADAKILPIELVPVHLALDELLGVALMNRPELAESRALVAAALTRWREDRTRPLLPSLQLAFYRSQFGAGVPRLHDYSGRDDFFIQANWELRNGGLGDWFQARAARAEYNAANFHVAEVQAQIAAEVTAAAKITRGRQQALQHAEEAVNQAEKMWARLAAGAFGVRGPARQYDPIEPLLAEQALRQARLQYLTEVIEYNRDQFRLFWAMGQPPEEALPKAGALPVRISVTPPPYKEPEPVRLPPPGQKP
jgi:outer membrane protein TolC